MVTKSRHLFADPRQSGAEIAEDGDAGAKRTNNWRIMTSALLTCLAMPSAPRACWARVNKQRRAAMILADRIFALSGACSTHNAFCIFKEVCNERHVRDDAYRTANCESIYQTLVHSEDGSEASVSLASIGNSEIRMFRGREADLDSKALFWLELVDHGTKTSVDSFRCQKIKDAVPVFENFLSQAVDLNKPAPGRATYRSEAVFPDGGNGVKL